MFKRIYVEYKYVYAEITFMTFLCVLYDFIMPFYMSNACENSSDY